MDTWLRIIAALVGFALTATAAPAQTYPVKPVTIIVPAAPGGVTDAPTLFIGPEVTFVVNPSLYGRLGYDPVNDFVPITGLVTINQALIVHPSLPADSVKDLLALARTKPGE